MASKGIVPFIILGILTLLACTRQPAESVIEYVEVTRVVPQTVTVTEIREVPVTRVVEVETPVTRTVEKTVEVTRVVEREVPVTVLVTPTLLPATPTPFPTATPTPTPTATTMPTATPKPVDLGTAERANLWVYLSNDGEHLQVFADPAFDVDRFELDLFVDGLSYCNSDRIYADDGPYEMSCEYENKSHASVKRVSAQTDVLGDLRCEQNIGSTTNESVFACVWRR